MTASSTCRSLTMHTYALDCIPMTASVDASVRMPAAHVHRSRGVAR